MERIWTVAYGIDRELEPPDRKKHGIDFRTAAKVFSDPHVIEFDDLHAADEPRFNAIGLVQRFRASNHIGRPRLGVRMSPALSSLRKQGPIRRAPSIDCGVWVPALRPGRHRSGMIGFMESIH
jgi:uncharacterized DUF497 family protein